jgi:hypothetical protein
LQSGPIAKEWPPILRGFRPSIQLGKFEVSASSRLC